MQESEKLRLLQERNELTLKINKLTSFIDSDEFTKLSFSNQYLLNEQIKVMLNYRDILKIRIELLNINE